MLSLHLSVWIDLFRKSFGKTSVDEMYSKIRFISVDAIRELMANLDQLRAESLIARRKDLGALARASDEVIRCKMQLRASRKPDIVNTV